MRITKKFLKDAKTKLRTRVIEATKMTDDELLAFLKTMEPNFNYQGTHDELLKRVLLWSLDEMIPDHMIQ